MAKTKTTFRVDLIPRFRGIKVASRELGITQQHLRRVLIGKCRNDALLGRVQKNYPGFIVERMP